MPWFEGKIPFSFNLPELQGSPFELMAMDVYAQAMTPAKRKAQGKVVAMLRDTEKKTS